MTPEEMADREARLVAEQLVGAEPRLIRTLANNTVGVHCSKPATLKAAYALHGHRLVDKLHFVADGIVIKAHEVTPLGAAVARALKENGK